MRLQDFWTPSLEASVLACLREKKGFGSESKRFGEAEKDNPGPGQYMSTHMALEYNRDSIGKKVWHCLHALIREACMVMHVCSHERPMQGFGPMVSRDKRWRNRIISAGPGPGEFEQRAPRENNFNKAVTTSAFHLPETSTIKPMEADEVPGE